MISVLCSNPDQVSSFSHALPSICLRSVTAGGTTYLKSRTLQSQKNELNYHARWQEWAYKFIIVWMANIISGLSSELLQSQLSKWHRKSFSCRPNSNVQLYPILEVLCKCFCIYNWQELENYWECSFHKPTKYHYEYIPTLRSHYIQRK